MKETIATAPRNIFHIKRRQLTDIGFRGLRKIGKELVGESNASSDTVVYPVISSERQLREIVNRLAWYLPPENTISQTIYIPLSRDVENGIPTIEIDSQPVYDCDHLDIEFVTPTRARGKLSDIDRILCHDIYKAIDRKFLQNIGRVEIIDETFYSARACSEWISATSALRQEPVDASAKNFRQIETKAKEYQCSFVFATGPSLEEAYSFEFPDDSLKIICNSIVRNEELLDHIDPDVLVFADPVFHFGPSKYAHEFREDAVQVLRDYDCVAAVTAPKRSLFVGHYPEIREQVIEIESVSSTLPRFPTHNSLDVMSTSNIMTLLMLPIASSLTQKVNIIGADGREENESYFWEHSDIAQYDDEMMKTAVNSHPSFFRDRVYTDYYHQHIKTLEKMIEYGEKHGIEYKSLTQSYVDCLQERYQPKPEF